nr:hypothetical protein [Cyanidiaceae sp.]
MHLNKSIKQYEGTWHIIHNSCYRKNREMDRQKGEIKLKFQRLKSTTYIRNHNSSTMKCLFNLIINYPKLNKDSTKHITLFASNLNPNLNTIVKQVDQSNLTLLGSCELKGKNIIHVRMQYKNLALKETIFLTNNNLRFSILIVKNKKEILNVTFSSWIRLKYETTLNLCD